MMMMMMIVMDNKRANVVSPPGREAVRITMEPRPSPLPPPGGIKRLQRANITTTQSTTTTAAAVIIML
jgi:hypothetical protein